MVVELKSENKQYLKMVEAHAGQPSRYSEDAHFARVSFLYCQFADDSSHKLIDTLEVRKPINCEKSPHAVLCLGTKGHVKVPSAAAVGSSTVAANNGAQA
jgi:hypothetical protein